MCFQLASHSHRHENNESLTRYLQLTGIGFVSSTGYHLALHDMMLQKIKIDPVGPQSAFLLFLRLSMDRKPDVAMRRWHDYDWEAVLAGQKVAQRSKFAWQIFSLGGTVLGQQPSWMNGQLASSVKKNIRHPIFIFPFKVRRVFFF